MEWQYVNKRGIGTILSVFILLFFVSMAYGQSTRESSPQDLPGQRINLEAPPQPPNPSQVVEQNSSNFQIALIGEPCFRHWWQTTSRSPLPPASAFALQTSLCKYLDSWPAPGTTVCENEPPDEELTDEDLM